MEASLADSSRVGAADIPSVDRILNRPALAALLAQHGRTHVTSILRSHLDELREAALAGTLQSVAVADDAIGAAVGRK